MAKQKRFKYRNQEYEIVKSSKQEADKHPYWPECNVCEEVNTKYLKGNPFKCIAMTRTGKDKFICTEKCGKMEYPKRIK